jgi:hypothetical protein
MDRADGCHHRGAWRNTLLGSRALPPGCTELSEEHILLGEQRAATRVYEGLRESFVGRNIGAPAEDLERNVIHPQLWVTQNTADHRIQAASNALPDRRLRRRPQITTPVLELSSSLLSSSFLRFDRSINYQQSRYSEGWSDNQRITSKTCLMGDICSWDRISCPDIFVLCCHSVSAQPTFVSGFVSYDRCPATS